MARGQTLQKLLQDLRAEIGHASAASVGQSEAPALKVLLARTQEFLYGEPGGHTAHMRNVWYDVSLAAGQRYYNLPTQLDYEKTHRAFYLYSGEWIPLPFGFDPPVYNGFDSDSDERSDPPQRWRLYGSSQFEVWPMPATNASATSGKVRFIGTRRLGPLVSDNDTADLDDRLIVLFAAAEKLAGKLSGKTKEALAARRLAQLKADGNKTMAFRPGDTTSPNRQPKEIVVRVAGT